MGDKTTHRDIGRVRVNNLTGASDILRKNLRMSGASTLKEAFSLSTRDIARYITSDAAYEEYETLRALYESNPDELYKSYVSSVIPHHPH